VRVRLFDGKSVALTGRSVLHVKASARLAAALLLASRAEAFRFCCSENVAQGGQVAPARDSGFCRVKDDLTTFLLCIFIRGQGPGLLEQL